LKIISQLGNTDVYKMLKDTGAILDGHFKLTSGYHSRYYLQCARLLEHPSVTLRLIESGLMEYDIFFNGTYRKKLDTVISPAIGGILFGYMLALKLDRRMIFTERKDKNMELRRGFEIRPGENVIIAEDVITTGGSVFEVIDICRALKANITAVISIVDRSEDIIFNYPYFSFIKLNIDKYLPDDCPLCRQGMEIQYPGSRKQ